MERKTRGPKIVAQNPQEKNIKIIGIAGAGKGVGVTHFSILLLNYLTGFLGKRAVLMEWNPSGDLHALEAACRMKNGDPKEFRILSGDYVKSAGREELESVLGGRYEMILIDFGNAECGDWSEFLRCDKQFLIGSFSEWQQERFREFELNRRRSGKKSWHTLAVFGSEETRKEFNRRYRMGAERIPFSADAFAVTEECRDFFERLLEEKRR